MLHSCSRTSPTCLPRVCFIATAIRRSHSTCCYYYYYYYYYYHYQITHVCIALSTTSIFELHLQFSPNCTPAKYLLTRFCWLSGTNIQTPAKILTTTYMHGGPRHVSRTTFWFVTHTDTQTRWKQYHLSLLRLVKILNVKKQQKPDKISSVYWDRLKSVAADWLRPKYV